MKPSEFLLSFITDYVTNPHPPCIPEEKWGDCRCIPLRYLHNFPEAILSDSEIYDRTSRKFKDTERDIEGEIYLYLNKGNIPEEPSLYFRHLNMCLNYEFKIKAEEWLTRNNDSRLVHLSHGMFCYRDDILKRSLSEVFLYEGYVVNVVEETMMHFLSKNYSAIVDRWNAFSGEFGKDISNVFTFRMPLHLSDTVNCNKLFFQSVEFMDVQFQNIRFSDTKNIDLTKSYFPYITPKATSLDFKVVSKGIRCNVEEFLNKKTSTYVVLNYVEQKSLEISSWWANSWNRLYYLILREAMNSLGM